MTFCFPLQENLRYGGRATGPTIRSRADRSVYVFLFRKMMLMTKREDDGYQYKLHLEVRTYVQRYELCTYMYVHTENYVLVCDL